jgi:hypothetical protein
MDDFEILADLAHFFVGYGILPNEEVNVHEEQPLPINNEGRVPRVIKSPYLLSNKSRRLIVKNLLEGSTMQQMANCFDVNKLTIWRLRDRYHAHGVAETKRMYLLDKKRRTTNQYHTGDTE